MNMKKLYIIEKDGRKRQAKKFVCKNCNKNFLGRKNSDRIFCSKKCQGEDKNKRNCIKLICEYCNKTFYKKKSALKNSKHKKYFCSRNCKDIAQSLKGNCSVIQPKHYGKGNGKYDYRDKAIEEYDAICSNCNYKEHKELLQVHHIDSDRDNNDIDNLIVLCPTCHWALTLKLSKLINRKWFWI